MVSWREMEISCETEAESDNNDKVKYIVELREGGEKHWKEVKSEMTDKK